MTRRARVVGAILGVTAAALIVDLTYGPHSRLRPGRRMPEFRLATPEGNAFHLSDYRGKVILINFFASW